MNGTKFEKKTVVFSLCRNSLTHHEGTQNFFLCEEKYNLNGLTFAALKRNSICKKVTLKIELGDSLATQDSFYSVFIYNVKIDHTKTARKMQLFIIFLEEKTDSFQGYEIRTIRTESIRFLRDRFLHQLAVLPVLHIGCTKKTKKDN